MSMPENNEEIDDEQRGRLAEWMAERDARMAALGHTPPAEGDLDSRLRELDAAFAENPQRDDPLVQENHELRRTVEIMEDAIRQLLQGQLPFPTAPAAESPR
jgi:hypothetical protein